MHTTNMTRRNRPAPAEVLNVSIFRTGLRHEHECSQPTERTIHPRGDIECVECHVSLAWSPTLVTGEAYGPDFVESELSYWQDMQGQHARVTAVG